MNSDSEANLGDGNPKFSSVLESCLKLAGGEEVTVGYILDRVGERGFGLILVLLALPTLIPILPPGASAVVGLLYVTVGLQMLAGATKPWLPNSVRRHKLSGRTAMTLRTRGVRIVQKVERFSRRRWGFMMRKPATQVLGLIVMMIGALLFLPLPFMNTAPGLAMLIVGTGLAGGDGVLVLVGAGLSLTLLFVAIRFGHVLAWLYRRLRSHVSRWPSGAR